MKNFNIIIISALVLLAFTGLAMAETNIDVTIYNNSITPQAVPIQFDSSWNPVFGFVYTNTVHGALTEAGAKLPDAGYGFLKYSNVDNSTGTPALINDLQNVYFNNETGWSIDLRRNNASVPNLSLQTQVRTGDKIILSKNNTVVYRINILNTSANPTIWSFNLAGLYRPSTLNLIDGQNRITNGPNNSNSTFNITLRGTYNASESHTFTGIPLNSGLGSLISGSSTNGQTQNRYTYNISAWYMDVNGTRDWYVWLDDINNVSLNWSMTGRGWFIGKSTFMNSSAVVPTESLERFNLNTGDILNLCMCPSSLAGALFNPSNGMPIANYVGARVLDSNGMVDTYYYPDSSSTRVKVLVFNLTPYRMSELNKEQLLQALEEGNLEQIQVLSEQVAAAEA